jgi:UDP-2,3-diacylglucosamine pyrophosphatase LpxH
VKHYVVSDLHIGMGREGERLHPLEDFDCHPQFERLLDLALANGGNLIINGDWIDFLRVEPFVGIGSYSTKDGLPLSYTASEAMQKLETVLLRQKDHFEALRKFIAQGGQIAIIQGNHDADWFFPAEKNGEPPLQKHVREILGSPSADGLRFVESSMRIRSVHIEHGHQRCEPLNAFQDHPNIFHADRVSPLTGALRMELLWGSRFVMEFFNDLEMKYPFASNLKPSSRAIWLGIKNRWINGKTAGIFLRFLLDAGLPMRDFVEVLEAPADDPVALIQTLNDESLKAMFLERINRDSTFLSELSASLERVPKTERERWRASQRSETGREEIVALGEQGVAGLIRESREFREAGKLLKEADISAVVFGHTHFAIDGNAQDAKTKGYFNTGTWTPALDLKEQETKRRLSREDFPVELLANGSLFRRRLTYAEITESSAGVQVELKEIS